MNTLTMAKKGTFESLSYWMVYYLVILVSMIVVTNPDTETNSLLRYAYVLAVFFPSLLRKEFFPFVIVCFCSISRQSFSPILPSSPTIYLGITVLFIIIYLKHLQMPVSASVGFAVLYFVLCCYIRLDIQGFIKWSIVAILLSLFIKDKNSLGLLSSSMVYISFFLSLLFLVFRDSFKVDYIGTLGEDLERIGWINPNEFGGAIACGFVVSVGYILNVIKLPISKLTKGLCYVTVVISFMVLLFNASRSSTIAAAFASLLILLFSKKSNVTKLIILVVFVIVFIFVSNSQLFVVFFDRMQDVETIETGSGRYLIWQDKLKEFLSTSNLVQLLFGLGKTNCDNLGCSEGIGMSTHNDFVTAFIAYGIVGLVLFVYVIMLPLIKMSKKNRSVVLPLLAFLIIENNTMEPFFRGNLQFYMFYTLILFYAKNKDLEGAD